MEKGKRKYHIICNPKSGTSRDKENIVKKVALAISKAGFEYSIDYTEHENHGVELSKKAQNEGADVIIVIGGDGTVNEVASSLVNTNTTLGIIPMGSGNGLARELGIPLDIQDAIETIMGNEVIKMDVVDVNGDYAFCTCGVGFDAEVSTEFAKNSKRGPMGYVTDVLETITKHEPLSCNIKIDDQEAFETKVFLITCANASQYGNNAYIAPNAEITDGLMDLTIMNEFPLIHVGQMAYQLFSKGLDKNPYIKTYKGKSAEISISKKTHYHIDGDPKPETDKLTLKTIPNSLKVIVGEYKRKEKTFIDIINSFTNDYLEWKDGILQDVKSTMKEIGQKIEDVIKE